MAKHSKAPTKEVKLWRGRLAMAAWYQKNNGNTDGRWDRYVKALAGDFGGSKSDRDERLDVNMVHGTTQIVLSPLYTSDPFITIKPKHAMKANVARARFTELEINYWMRELKVRTQVTRPAVHDVETTNHGWAYLGFVDDSNKKILDKDRRRPDYEPNPLIREGQPFVLNLTPKQVLVPPGHWLFEDHPWVAIEWRKTPGQVEDQFGVKVAPTLDPFDETTLQKQKSEPDLARYLNGEDARLVQLTQIWSKELRKVVTVAAGHNDVLESAAWPYEMEGFPCSHLTFVHVPEEFYGTPPMEMYFPQQVELNLARTASKNRNNRTKNVIFMRQKEAETVRKAYAKAADGEIIGVPISDEMKLSDVMYVEPGMPAPHENYADGSIQMSDLFTIRGIGLTQRGFGDPNIDTATQSANVEKWNIIRSVDAGDRVRTWYLDIAHKLWMILKQRPSVKRDRRILGDLGAAITSVSYTLAELEGEFEFSMDVGTMMADNPAQRQQLALANYNLFRADPLVDPTKLLLDVLDSQGKVDPTAYLQKLRTPTEELEMMVNGLPVEPHERDPHVQHQQEHTQQMEALARALDQVDAKKPEGEKIRTAMLLVMAHLNATGKIIAELTEAAGGTAPGNPLDINAQRNQLARQPAGQETSAELGGQPVGPV